MRVDPCSILLSELAREGSQSKHSILRIASCLLLARLRKDPEAAGHVGGKGGAEQPGGCGCERFDERQRFALTANRKTPAASGRSDGRPGPAMGFMSMYFLGNQPLLGCWAVDLLSCTQFASRIIAFYWLTDQCVHMYTVYIRCSKC